MNVQAMHLWPFKYYIDGTVLDSRVIPILMVDTENDKYYQVTDSGKRLIEPYEE